MSRIKELFDRKKKRVLNVYCTAGYPQLNSTGEVMESLQAAGADLIELGMPYSDPLADGPVIQQSSSIALENGMTIQRLFDQLKDFRKSITVPVVLMGYMNPVMQYGMEKFCREAAEAGIDGLIIPDLPMHEFDGPTGSIIKRYKLDFIFLITPETSEQRVRKLDSISSGFLYAVSSSSTTGSGKENTTLGAYLQKLQQMNLNNPVLVGFGIKDKPSFDEACSFSAGAIIGSAYIQALGRPGNIPDITTEFVKSVVGSD